MNIPDKLAEAIAAIPLALEEFRSEMASGLAEYHNGVRLRGSRYVSAPRSLVWGGPGRLVGWSVRAVGGAAVVNLRDGHDVGGDIIATISLTADGAAQTITFPGGVSFVEALFAELPATNVGTITGAYWLGAVD